MKLVKKLKKYLPLTKKQLNEIVECYATVFPGWKVVDGNRFIRSLGPIVQQIGFQGLRYKAYRPMGVIWALPYPNISMLHQFLDIKHRQVRLREHPTKWKSVVTAMEEQFQPSIRKPLDLQEIRCLCEQNAGEKTHDMCMLAILNAYLGERDQALFYCERIQNVPSPIPDSFPDWQKKHREFGRQLRQAIEAGNERQFLDDAASANPEQ